MLFTAAPPYGSVLLLRQGEKIHQRTFLVAHVASMYSCSAYGKLVAAVEYAVSVG